MYSTYPSAADFDPELWQAVLHEQQRQEDHIELIASENYASPRVMALQGSVFTNKYAEGYPGKRYYGGCEFVDIAENLAIARAKQLFQADYANVQPHSGSQANEAAYMAMMQPGDTLLALDLSHGGHLSHGAKVSFSGRIYKAMHYSLNLKTEEIDYDQMLDLAKQYRPKVLVGGFSAYSRIVDWKKMRDIADQVNAYLMVDIAHVAGLIAAGLYPSPVSIADVTTTTTHKTLRGPRGGIILAKANPELEKKLNSAVFPGTQGGPLMHVIAAKAIAFKEALDPAFKVYQQKVLQNAKTMAQTVMQRGYHVVSHGTDNHLFLTSFLDKSVTGKQAETRLGEANITLNKNTVPGETRSPFVTSGIRIGTPAITTRGFETPEAKQVANWICDILDDIENETLLVSIKLKVLALCKQFPVYRRE